MYHVYNSLIFLPPPPVEWHGQLLDITNCRTLARLTSYSERVKFSLLHQLFSTWISMIRPKHKKKKTWRWAPHVCHCINDQFDTDPRSIHCKLCSCSSCLITVMYGAHECLQVYGLCMNKKISMIDLMTRVRSWLRPGAGCLVGFRLRLMVSVGECR